MNEENDLDSFVDKICATLFGNEWDKIRSTSVQNPSSNKKTLSELLNLAHLEKSLNLPAQFLEKLVGEDDWSFIIKVHALLEAAFSHLLTEYLGKPELSEIFSRMELSNSHTGKIVFAEKLNLVDKDTRRFLRKLSEIRNQFVHDVSNVNLDLNGYIRRKDKNGQTEFKKAFCWDIGSDETMDLWIGESGFDPIVLLKVISKGSFEVSPKISVWLGAIICMRVISRQVSVATLSNEMDETLRELVPHLVDQNLEED